MFHTDRSNAASHLPSPGRAGALGWLPGAPLPTFSSQSATRTGPAHMLTPGPPSAIARQCRHRCRAVPLAKAGTKYYGIARGTREVNESSSKFSRLVSGISAMRRHRPNRSQRDKQGQLHQSRPIAAASSHKPWRPRPAVVGHAKRFPLLTRNATPLPSNTTPLLHAVFHPPTAHLGPVILLLLSAVLLQAHSPLDPLLAPHL